MCLVALLLVAPLLAYSSTPERAVVQVVLGVSEPLRQEAIAAIRSELDVPYSLVLSDLPPVDGTGEIEAEPIPPIIEWNTDAQAILAVGRQGCEAATHVPTRRPVLCVLLSADAFDALRQKSGYGDLHAIVVDQPTGRQAKVASSIYPALKQFAVLTLEEDTAEGGAMIERVPFQADNALAAQVTHALVGNDALIATPEHQIYNRSTLRTVLLTAYGYTKPVIGYSRAYVTAGALISSYSSSSHTIRQAAELLPELLKDEHARDTEAQSPRYFSIADNPGVARSLGLIKRRSFAMDDSYSDEDFAS